MASSIQKIDLSIRKKLKLSSSLEEEMTVEEVIERFEPYLIRKSIDYAVYAERVHSKHLFFFSSEDIKQQAYLGAMDAFRRYDISKNVIFYTFLSNTVDGVIKNYLYRKAGLLKSINAYDFQETSFDMDLARLSKKGEILSLKDVIADENDEYENIVNKEEIISLMSVLTPTEKEYMILRYFHEETYKSIGAKYNLTKQRIEQSIKKSIIKMKKHIEYIKRKEVVKMKTKPSKETVLAYLTKNANKTITFTQAVKEYSNSLDLSITTVMNILKETGKTTEVKSLYRDLRAKEIVAEVEIAKQEIAATEEAISIKELTAIEATEEVVVPTNPLDGLKVTRIVYETPEGQEIDIDDERVYVSGGWLTRDEISQSIKDSEKILEVYDYIYKK